MRQIFFDIETTGFKHAEGHRIVEIAAIEYIDRQPTNRKVHLYFDPERVVPPEVIKIHGLDNNFLKDFKPFRETIQEFVDFVKLDGGCEAIAHNGDNFDIPFIDAELSANGFQKLSEIEGFLARDSLKVARAISGSKQNSLDALCDKYKVDRSNRTAHGALIDCELLAEVWYRLTQSIDFEAPDTSDRQEPIVRLVNKPSLRVAKADESSLEEHQAYLSDWRLSLPETTLPDFEIGASLSEPHASPKKSIR